MVPVILASYLRPEQIFATTGAQACFNELLCLLLL